MIIPTPPNKERVGRFLRGGPPRGENKYAPGWTPPPLPPFLGCCLAVLPAQHTPTYWCLLACFSARSLLLARSPAQHTPTCGCLFLRSLARSLALRSRSLALRPLARSLVLRSLARSLTATHRHRHTGVTDFASSLTAVFCYCFARVAKTLQRGHPQQTATAMPMLWRSHFQCFTKALKMAPPQGGHFQCFTRTLKMAPPQCCLIDHLSGSAVGTQMRGSTRHLPISASSINRKQPKKKVGWSVACHRTRATAVRLGSPSDVAPLWRLLLRAPRDS